jgi:transposase-like protein
VYNYKGYSELCQKRLRITNVLERLNLELKRWTKKVEALPSDRSLLRLVVTMMLDINKGCITWRRNINMEQKELWSIQVICEIIANHVHFYPIKVRIE